MARETGLEPRDLRRDRPALLAAFGFRRGDDGELVPHEAEQEATRRTRHSLYS
jgi:hypothetical protein